MASRTPNLFSIAPGAPFLPTLADAILAGRLVSGWHPAHDPLALSQATVFLPTRRAARALNTLLAQRSGGKSVLLPRIIPLGDVEDAEDNIMFDGGSEAFGDDGTLPPEANPTFRRLMLAQLVLRWSGQVRMRLAAHDPDAPMSAKLQDAVRLDPQGFIVATTARDALSLADALGRLIDSLTIHGKNWEELHKLVPSEFDEYWRISRDFVQIAAEVWPKICSDAGVQDASLRRHALINAEAARLTRTQPDAPFIVAGSTGSMPATANLIAAISRLPRGAVVLPGLDFNLDQASWDMLTEKEGEPGHPQMLLAHLLQVIGTDRASVQRLGEATPALALREAFLSEALRPAQSTELWENRARHMPDTAIAEALADVRIVEADDEREEALAIAAVLRETLETPNKIAGLVTPDRTLAERVSAELARWGIEVEDSAGLALGRSDAGRLLRLVADAATEDFSAASLLALLDHPMTRLGLAPETLASGRTTLEIGLLRGPDLGPGLSLMATALHQRRNTKPKYPTEPQMRLVPKDWDAAASIIDALTVAFSGLAPFQTRQSLDLLAAVHALEATLAALVDDPANPDAFDRAEGGEAIAAFFDDMKQSDSNVITGRLVDLPGFLDGLLAGRTVIRTGHSHPRIRIWGLLEARLLPVDRLVLGGLDETVWPPATRTDPFLSRPFAHALSLPSPERRIGQTAHDFAQGFGAAEVIITRANKRGGDPMVPSRFLQRMRAVAGTPAYDAMCARGKTALDWARSLDQIETPPPRIAQPQPIPDADLVPRQLTITEVETLRRDPYSIYAKHVLRLDTLDPLARPPNAADRGTAVHDAIGAFGERFPDDLPDNPLEELLTLGRKSFESIADQPQFAAFWWPRFVRSAQWLVAWEHMRRADGTQVRAERSGKLTFPLPSGGDFTLRGRADRIEIHPGSTFTVVDYKTGKKPGVNEVRCGFSPQLTITAALAERGAFEGIKGQPEDLIYVKLGSRDGGKSHSVVKGKDPVNAGELSEQQWNEFVKLADQFANYRRGFASRPYPKFLKSFLEYDHLARVKEWSVGGDDDAEGGE